MALVDVMIGLAQDVIKIWHTVFFRIYNKHSGTIKIHAEIVSSLICWYKTESFTVKMNDGIRYFKKSLLKLLHFYQRMCGGAKGHGNGSLKQTLQDNSLDSDDIFIRRKTGSLEADNHTVTLKDLALQVQSLLTLQNEERKHVKEEKWASVTMRKSRRPKHKRNHYQIATFLHSGTRAT